MNKLSSSVLHLAAVAAIATSSDIMANANDTTKAVITKPAENNLVSKVSKNTIERIKKLQDSFPDFKPNDIVKGCILGEIDDDSCNEIVENEATIGEKMKQLHEETQKLATKKDELLAKDKALDEKDKALDEKDKALDEKDKALTEEKQALTEEKQALEKIKIIGDDITITTGLIQLGLYIDYNQVPSSEADAMSKVTGNKNTPEEVLILFTEYLDHKKNGGTFTWRTHGERLISLANKYLTKAMEIESSIQNPDIKKDATDLIKLTVKFYDTNVKMLNKNDNPIVAIK